MTFWMAAAARVSIVVAAALLGTVILRRRSASARHAALAAGVVAALAMPGAQAFAAWCEMPRPAMTALIGHAMSTVSPDRGPWDAAAVQAMTASSRYAPFAGLAAFVWVAGALLGLAWVLVGLLRLSWLVSRCRTVASPRWTNAARHVATRVGLDTRVVILQSGDARLLCAWGVRCARVIVPDGAETWSDERIHLILCHELAHVRRRHWPVQIAAGVLRAIYWFDPLVWIVSRKLRQESERAADDDVLALGVSGDRYASELLSIAHTLRRPAWSPAPAMARPSSLQRRVRAMLTTSLDRRPVSVRERLTIGAAALAVAVFVAASGATAQAGPALSGSFVDALNNAVPGVELTVTNNDTGEKYTLRSDAEGRFSFDALPDGFYQGVATAQGFRETHPFFRILNRQLTEATRVVPLPLGQVEESVVVVENGDNVTIERTLPTDRLAALREKMQRAPLAPPIKLRDVRPLFPANRSGRTATIFLEGVIDTNGNVRGSRCCSPPTRRLPRPRRTPWASGNSSQPGCTVSPWTPRSMRPCASLSSWYLGFGFWDLGFGV